MKNFLYCVIGGSLLLNQVNSIDELRSNASVKACKIKIAIGSTNPVKIQAVKNVLDASSEIIPCSVQSHVRPQPLSDEETLQGAINRAKNCLEQTESNLAIGLEAGVVLLQNQVYLCHWGAIVDRKQNVYFTNGPLILLPLEYRKALWEGKNLEDIMHQSTGIQCLGAKEGAIGIFTENRLNREQVLTQMVKALIGQYQYYQSEVE
jgi:inosine/xanthosine triphosphatase